MVGAWLAQSCSGVRGQPTRGHKTRQRAVASRQNCQERHRSTWLVSVSPAPSIVAGKRRAWVHCRKATLTLGSVGDDEIDGGHPLQ
jgi:hypothetical protein